MRKCIITLFSPGGWVVQDLWDISPKIASRTVSPEFQRNYQLDKDRLQATGPKAGFTPGTGEVSGTTLITRIQDTGYTYI